MSATILKFRTGETVRRGRPPVQNQTDAKAIRHARLIKTAKGENDDWTARLLIALISTMDRGALNRLELVLGNMLGLAGPVATGPVSESALQAYTLVELANGDQRHRERVGALLQHMCGESLL